MGKIERLIEDIGTISAVDVRQATWSDLVKLSSYINLLKDMVDEEAEERLG